MQFDPFDCSASVPPHDSVTTCGAEPMKLLKAFESLGAENPSRGIDVITAVQKQGPKFGFNFFPVEEVRIGSGIGIVQLCARNS
jgi:hypothetical protein